MTFASTSMVECGYASTWGSFEASQSSVPCSTAWSYSIAWTENLRYVNNHLDGTKKSCIQASRFESQCLLRCFNGIDVLKEAVGLVPRGVSHVKDVILEHTTLRVPICPLIVSMHLCDAEPVTQAWRLRVPCPECNPGKIYCNFCSAKQCHLCHPHCC